ncbi:GGDEF domain-containing protein [Tannockella kyphosi]|uniref:GGDEF domain-containing protein n=1 Tax=Tannockella kyphosi TaxID=2899121 RepID=UPI002012B42A|nr:diguanylate cyclase [Tannockella kyphosi]
MDSFNYDFLLEQLKKILLNVELTKDDLVSCDKTINNVQEGLLYLSNCVQELNEFSSNICKGNLDAPLPGRHNLLTGGLKELHGVLKHLTWQTQQVANGDYAQKVIFLGDFSESFNEMIRQLEERENKLKENAITLKKTTDLLKVIMDAHSDWIVVEDIESGVIIYNNKEEAYQLETFSLRQIHFTKMDSALANEETTIYYNEILKSYHALRSYDFLWEGKRALVHYVSDVTKEQTNQLNLTQIAYSDALTGCYNRRFCFNEIKKRLTVNDSFSITLIDINDLKIVNDNFGHNQGDYYINYVTKCTIQHIDHTTEYLCRIGGDEFVVISTLSYLEMEQKMQSVFNEIIAASPKEYTMSISYGIQEVETGCGNSIEKILDECDQKMYLFKQEYKLSRGA